MFHVESPGWNPRGVAEGGGMVVVLVRAVDFDTAL